ncbi:transporter substrate-binding domain-containing protein, partial [uncultured Cetobacterium sp.]
MRFIFIYFLCFFTIFSQNVYIPKNKQEKNILKKYKKKELTLGLFNSDFKCEVYNNNSINLIIEDLLKNYLQLNIKVIKGDWNTIIDDYKNKRIDIVGGLTPTKQEEKYLYFSNVLYSQGLYLVSNKNIVSDFKNFKNEKIYILKNFEYSNSIKKYLELKDIHAKLIPINLKDVRNESYYIGLNRELIGFKYKQKVGNIPGASLGVCKKDKDLLLLINSALNEKYHKEISQFLTTRKNIIYREKFMNSLNIDEKKYLKNLNSISIYVDDKVKNSDFYRINNNYDGSMYLILKKLSMGTGIKFDYITNSSMGFHKAYKELEEGKIDILPMVKTKQREKSILFTKKIDDLILYKISSYSINKNNITGRLHGKTAKSLTEEYSLNENIKPFKNIDLLNNALKNNQINSAFILSYDDLDIPKYKVEKIEQLPIYLG